MEREKERENYIEKKDKKSRYIQYTCIHVNVYIEIEEDKQVKIFLILSTIALYNTIYMIMYICHKLN